jgi:hypothetical protein
MATRSVRLDSARFVGICPACSQPVPWDDPDGPVWTCPADLSPSNPYWEPANPRITSELQARSGVYSQCAEDFAFTDVGHGGCYDRLPLHGACYDRGGY